MTAEAGATVHIPPGVPHALALPPAGTGKLLMIFQPAGFDRYLLDLSKLSEKDFSDADRMRELELKYDIVNLGGVPPRG